MTATEPHRLRGRICSTIVLTARCSGPQRSASAGARRGIEVSLVELVRSAAGMRMQDEDGSVEHLELSVPMSASELRSLERALPCPIPTEVRELLEFSKGFENGPLESLQFGGVPGGFELGEVFPNPVPLAHDGFGNYWIVDLHAASTTWGPILYACHDPPVIVFQTSSLEHFIKEVLRLANPPHHSDVDEVHDRAAMSIWRKNPGATPVEQLRTSTDPAISAFVESLPGSSFVIDLRGQKPGSGFSWGRFGPKTRVVRFHHELLFACESKSWFQRIFGR
jgi:SMI1 / KNR4 family (SUKH-1)